MSTWELKFLGKGTQKIIFHFQLTGTDTPNPVNLWTFDQISLLFPGVQQEFDIEKYILIFFILEDTQTIKEFRSMQNEISIQQSAHELDIAPDIGELRHLPAVLNQQMISCINYLMAAASSFFLWTTGEDLQSRGEFLLCTFAEKCYELKNGCGEILHALNGNPEKLFVAVENTFRKLIEDLPSRVGWRYPKIYVDIKGDNFCLKKIDESTFAVNEKGEPIMEILDWGLYLMYDIPINLKIKEEYYPYLTPEAKSVLKVKISKELAIRQMCLIYYYYLILSIFKPPSRWVGVGCMLSREGQSSAPAAHKEQFIIYYKKLMTEIFFLYFMLDRNNINSNPENLLAPTEKILDITNGGGTLQDQAERLIVFENTQGIRETCAAAELVMYNEMEWLWKEGFIHPADVSNLSVIAVGFVLGSPETIIKDTFLKYLYYYDREAMNSTVEPFDYGLFTILLFYLPGGPSLEEAIWNPRAAQRIISHLNSELSIPEGGGGKKYHTTKKKQRKRTKHSKNRKRKSRGRKKKTRGRK